jgi:predicted Zn-dependent peptidase
MSFQMLTLAGSRMELEGKRGLAHLVEHLLFAGTSKHSANELVQQIYDYGGELNAYTNNDCCVVHCKLRAPHLEHMLSFFSEILYDSIFSDESIEREKKVVLAEIALRTGSPLAMLTMVLLPQRAWVGTPASQPVGGNEADIQSITRNDVVQFVERMYQPQNIVLSVSGNIPSNIAELLDHYFSYHVESRYMGEIPLATGVKQDQPQNYDTSDNNSDATIALAFPYDTEPFEKYVGVLSYALIETMSCRVFRKLRTELGLIYSVNTLSNSLRDISIFGFAFRTKNTDQNIKTCIDGSMAILKDVVQNGITVVELDRAKAFIVESMLLGLENTMTLAAYYGEQLLLKDEIVPYNDRIDEIRTITNDDIRRTASELFTTSRLNLAIIN